MQTTTELRDFGAFTKAVSRRAATFPQEFQHCIVQAAAAGNRPIFYLLRLGIRAAPI
jgi:hypothetical protein